MKWLRGTSISHQTRNVGISNERSQYDVHGSVLAQTFGWLEHPEASYPQLPGHGIQRRQCFIPETVQKCSKLTLEAATELEVAPQVLPLLRKIALGYPCLMNSTDMDKVEEESSP